MIVQAGPYNVTLVVHNPVNVTPTPSHNDNERLASNKPKIDEMPKNPFQTEGREGVNKINKVPKTSSLTEKRGAFGSSLTTT